MEDKKEIPVLFTEELYQKLTELTDQCDNEIGGILLGEVKDRFLILNNVIVPKQKVTTGEVTIDAEAVADAITPLMKKDPTITQRVKGWWHSHSNMSTFWSNVDEDTITSLVDFMGFCVSVNTNKKGSILIRIDMNNPFYLSMDKLNYDILHENSDKIKKWAKKEIEKKVTQSFDTTWDSRKGWVQQYIKTEDDFRNMGKAGMGEIQYVEMIKRCDTLSEFQTIYNHLWRRLTKRQKKIVKKYFREKQKTERHTGYQDYLPQKKTQTQEEAEEDAYNRGYPQYYA